MPVSVHDTFKGYVHTNVQLQLSLNNRMYFPVLDIVAVYTLETGHYHGIVLFVAKNNQSLR